MNVVAMKKESLVMKGFAMKRIGEAGWIEKQRPQCGPLDAIITPLALAPCTSDVHTVWEGGVGERYNVILGHEAVGEIVEIGKDVRDFKPGDKVIVPAITPDWNTMEIQKNLHPHSGGMLAGYQFTNIKDGVFGEYFHVNHADMNLALLPDGISYEAALMMTDMMTTGVHGAELADIQMGDTVAVLGIGPVGLMSVAGAKLRGAGRIIVVGNRPVTIEAAKYYGATDIIDYKEGPIVEQVMELTKNKGVEATIIAGGGTDILSDAVKITAPGGNIGNVNYFGEGEILPIPRLEWGLGMAHKTIRGGLTPGGRVRMEKMIALVQADRIDPERMVTHVLNGFESVEQALLMMRDKPRDMIKPVVIV